MFKPPPTIIFYLHYILLTSGMSGATVLLGVLIEEYSDASQLEIGILLASLPFVSIFTKPLFCSLADNYQKHQFVLILALIFYAAGYLPCVTIPFYPKFYLESPRYAWYLFVLGSHVGNIGLAVSFSLGDALAINCAQKSGTPYARMRMWGTISWGIYGYIIGQINETSPLPKMVPGYLIMQVSILIDILLLCVWPKDAFKMCDASDILQEISTTSRLNLNINDANCNSIEVGTKTGSGTKTTNSPAIKSLLASRESMSLMNSMPGSVGGSLRCTAKTASALKSLLSNEDLADRLTKALDNKKTTSTLTMRKSRVQTLRESDLCRMSTSLEIMSSSKGSLGNDRQQKQQLEQQQQQDNANPIERKEANEEEEVSGASKNKSLQMILLKLIWREDKRFAKYLIIYAAFGFFLSGINFIFMKMARSAEQKGDNFSHVAGAMLVAPAAIETLVFFLAPKLLARMSKASCATLCFAIYVSRYAFFAIFFQYNDYMSHYWAVFGEALGGAVYGIFISMLAELSLMFASESKLFIPELRKLGLVSERRLGNEAQVEEEELRIRLALRATMQSLFSGFLEGFGIASGSVFCGLVTEFFDYIILCEVFTLLATAIMIFQLILELSKCKFSDCFKAKPGTRAFEALELERHEKEILRQMRAEQKAQKSSVGVRV